MIIMIMIMIMTTTVDNDHDNDNDHDDRVNIINGPPHRKSGMFVVNPIFFAGFLISGGSIKVLD